MSTVVLEHLFYSVKNKLRGGSTNPNVYNQLLMTAERNREEPHVLPNAIRIRKKSGLMQAGIEPTTLGVLAHYSNH